MDLNKIREALAAQVRPKVQSSYAFVPDTITTSPIFYLTPTQINQAGFGDRWHVELDATLIVATSWDEAAQADLAGMAMTVRDALSQNMRGLDGVWHSLYVGEIDFLTPAGDGAPVGCVYRLKLEA